MKVKLFEVTNSEELEININNFLKVERLSLNQTRIKYALSHTSIYDSIKKRTSSTIYSAMILYDTL